MRSENKKNQENTYINKRQTKKCNVKRPTKKKRKKIHQIQYSTNFVSDCPIAKKYN